MKNLVKLGIISALLLSLVFISGCGEAVCGTRTETYTSNAKGCDQMSNCNCIHESWGGLGSCDSCECTRQVRDC